MRHEDTREAFCRFAIDTAKTTWTIATVVAGVGKRVTELIVTGGKSVAV